MAQTERANEERRAGKRDKAKAARGRRAASAGRFELTPEALGGLMLLAYAFAMEDGALRIGLTRDGGALALGCYMGDDYATEYIRPSETMTTAIDEIAVAWLEDGTAALERAEQALRR